MPSVGYIVEDVVFYLWLIILIGVVARNTHFEFKYLKNEKRTIVRALNRCNAFVLLFLLFLAPDWSSYKGLIPRNGLYQAIFYSLVICVQFIEFFLYIFLTTRAMIFAKKTALAGSQPFERSLSFLKNTFILATSLLFIVDAIRMALYYTYNQQYYHGMWLLYVGTCALLSCIVFFFVSSRLKAMLAHLKYGEFSGIRAKLTKLQWLSGPICLAIFAATMWVGIGEMNDKPQPVPDPEAYSFRYSLFAWGHLIYASAFAYVAWQPMSSLRGRPSISVPNRQNSRRSANGFPPVPGLHPQGSHSFLPSIPDKENTGGTDDSSSGGIFSASPKQRLEEGPSPPGSGSGIAGYSKGTFASLPPYQHQQPRLTQLSELQRSLPQQQQQQQQQGVESQTLKSPLPHAFTAAYASTSQSGGLSPADSLSPPLSARSHYTPIALQSINPMRPGSVTTLDTSTMNGESRAPSSTVLSCDTDFSSGTLRNESRTITITKLSTLGFYDTERGGTSAGWL